MKGINRIILSIIISGLITTPANSSMDRCLKRKIFKTQLNTLVKDRDSLAKLQQMKIDAEGLRDDIIDGYDPASIGNTEQQIALGLAQAEEEQRTNKKVEVASWAGIAFFGTLIVRMNRTTKGQGVIRRLIHHLSLKTDRRPVFRHFLSVGFAMSLAHAVYFSFRLYKNNEKQEKLGDMIVELNKMVDQAQKIKKLDEDIESIDTELEFLEGDLKDEGVLTEKNGALVCKEIS